MLDNTTYNLMETAAVISKGLHRYESRTTPKDVRTARGCGIK
jgi:hypothetical protein